MKLSPSEIRDAIAGGLASGQLSYKTPEELRLARRKVRSEAASRGHARRRMRRKRVTKEDLS